MCGSQEQGPLTHHLLQAGPRTVQLVGWLQCERRAGLCNDAIANPPAFEHFAGCSFDHKKVKRCLFLLGCLPPNATGPVDTRASWMRMVAVHAGELTSRRRPRSDTHSGQLVPHAVISRPQAQAARNSYCSTHRCCQRHPRACDNSTRQNQGTKKEEDIGTSAPDKLTGRGSLNLHSRASNGPMDVQYPK